LSGASRGCASYDRYYANQAQTVIESFHVTHPPRIEDRWLLSVKPKYGPRPNPVQPANGPGGYSPAALRSSSAQILSSRAPRPLTSNNFTAMVGRWNKMFQTAAGALLTRAKRTLARRRIFA
jgi:hypothetical protein